jgi:acetate kinase
MCAIRAGQSIGSTMGFTALDGLPMGTRCGQLDPGVILYLMTTKGMSPDEISDLLYKKSGLKGLSGISQDMRALSQSDDPRAAEAIEYYVFRVRRELGAMAAVLSGVDTLVFTGGIGENSALIRERVCTDQEWLGIQYRSCAEQCRRRPHFHTEFQSRCAGCSNERGRNDPSAHGSALASHQVPA